jgi:predicted restriction endonuclease
MKIDRKKVFDKCNGHCAYCGKPIEYKGMQVDHVYPKRLGGTDDIDNLLPTCRLCNHYKRGNTLEGFRSMMLSIHERIEKIYIVRVAMNYGFPIAKFDGIFYFENTYKIKSYIKIN